MTTIGIIGAGEVGSQIARAAIAAGGACATVGLVRVVKAGRGEYRVKFMWRLLVSVSSTSDRRSGG